MSNFNEFYFNMQGVIWSCNFVGFEGVICQINIDECVSNLCQNGVICKDKINVYMCFCVYGKKNMVIIS